jgi:hypothetical protein
VSIDVICPHCEARVGMPDDSGGKAESCPRCGKLFTVPMPRVQPQPRREEPPPPPRRSRPWDEEEVDDRPRRSRDDDRADDRSLRRRDDHDDDRPRRSVRSDGTPPGKVQAVAAFTLIGGIVATLGSLLYAVIAGLSSLGLCCLWPGWIYALVVGILGIVKGAALLGQNARSQPAPKTIGILMIINVVNLDLLTCVMGVLIVVFVSDPEVQDYYRG